MVLAERFYAIINADIKIYWARLGFPFDSYWYQRRGHPSCDSSWQFLVAIDPGNNFLVVLIGLRRKISGLWILSTIFILWKFSSAGAIVSYSFLHACSGAQKNLSEMFASMLNSDPTVEGRIFHWNDIIKNEYFLVQSLSNLALGSKKIIYILNM